MGCTHYCLLKDRIKALTNDSVDIIAQDEIIPIKLHDYLKRHEGMQGRLTKNSTFNLCVTDKSDSFTNAAQQIIENDNVEIELVSI